MIRVSYQEVVDVLVRVLLKLGFRQDRAGLCARLFADADRDGVYSHGIERFPRFVRGIQKGIIDIHSSPEMVSSCGALERWNGKSGPGNLNAHQCMQRAIDLSREQGMGCVALANTNHWMRGGTYGWQAAEAGVIGICWTNTMPNLPPWGASDPRVGNNPLVIAVPRREGHVVLDMAMSQFSYGALASYRARSEPLPVYGGFDTAGRLTRDAAAIEASGRPLPIGYWKGSGLALMLDLLAGLLSGGKFTHQIPADPELEGLLSQIFIALDVATLDQAALATALTDQVIASLQSSPQTKDQVRYPGQQVLETRKKNMAAGVPVEPRTWQEIQRLSARNQV